MKAKPRGKPKAKGASNAYHWFQGASVRELYDRIGAANPDTARLEVRVTGDKMYLSVVGGSDMAAAATPAINESHICPPSCP